jgi:DNA-binding NtrC family response regulator
MLDSVVVSSSGGDRRTRSLTRRGAKFKRFRATVVTGADAGVSVIASDRELTIGSDPANDLILSDATVSSHHCVIGVHPNGYQIKDLGSTNGTRVNDVRIESAFLVSGAILEIGSTRVRFEGLTDEVREVMSDDDRYGRALGSSPAMRRIFALLPRIAASDSTALLEGETGTGKSLLAEAIHQQSARRDKPFIIVDCSAIPPTLIESELFGHEKGSFTGAHAARAGAFEAAQGGTIFLDEIGELPLDMQPKLLRALEERTIKRIGSTEPVRLDVRVIAATNRELRREVNKNTFRSDLYYRLNTVRLRIPPLRERREDIPLLVAHFYRQFEREGGEPPAELLASLTRQDWPGNVRELRSAVERAVLMGPLEMEHNAEHGADSDGARSSDPSLSTEAFDATLPFRSAKERVVARWERWWCAELVRTNEGNLSRAARAARMDRNHLRELLRRHGVSTKDE